MKDRSRLQAEPGKVEHASLVDLQGRETVLVSGGSVVHAASPLHIHGVYGLVVNGERSVVLIADE